MQRHLAAFEALDAHAGARLLALAAAAAGLALARADAAADALARLACAPALSAIWLSFIGLLPYAFDDAHECATLAIMPRIAGVSGSVALAADLVEAEADQRRALVVLAADRAADLLDRDGLASLAIALMPRSD